MKVSIAVPVFEYYGRGVEVLDDMLRTISYQTLKDVEVVISDHSLNEEIKNYCNTNEYNLNIKYFRNENDRGNPALNTNNAIDKCTGEIIKIFQQDDFFFDTEALEVMYREMTQSSQKWFVCGAIHTRDDGNSFYHPMLPRWDDKLILEDQHNFIGGVSVLSLKQEVKTRFDQNVRMLLDVDFYYNTMLNYGMPILYQDILVANRVRDTDTLMSEISESDVIKEFEYCHKKYGIVK
jgi:hypothetical protein